MAPQATAPQSFAPERAIETAAPRVTLRNSFAHPYDSAIAAARTCYSPRIIGPEEVSEKQRINIGAPTFYGGPRTLNTTARFRLLTEPYRRTFLFLLSPLHSPPFS